MVGVIRRAWLPLSQFTADVVNAQNFGVKGGGATDDSFAIREAVAEARSGGKPLWFPPGLYRTTQALTEVGQTGPLEIFGPGATIQHDFASSGAPPLIGHSGGAIGNSITVTASIAKGATTIQMADTSSLSDGQYFVLRDRAQQFYGYDSPYDPGGGGVEGCVLRVASVDDANTITIRGAVEEDYTLVTDGTWADDNVDIRPLTLTPGLYIHDIAFDNVSQRDSSHLSGVLNADYWLAPRIERVTFSRFNWAVLRIGYSVDLRVSDCLFENISAAVSDEGGNGYGLNCRPGTNGRMERCTGKYLRHLFTTVGTPDEIPCARGMDIIDCDTYYNFTASYDTHGSAKNVRFINCRDHFHKGGSQTTSFQIRGRDIEVINPTITGGGQDFGIHIVMSAHRCAIRGGLISGADIGIQVWEADGFDIQGTKILSPAGADRAVLIKANDNYPVPVATGIIHNLDIEGVSGDATTVGVEFEASVYVPGVRVGEVRTRNVTAPVTNAPSLPSLIPAYDIVRPLPEIIAKLGLEANLTVLLDPADARCLTAPTATKLFDLSGNGEDFFRGSDGGSGAPATVGLIGTGRATTYPAFTGTEFLRYDTTIAAYQDAMHQDGALFTFLMWVYFGSVANSGLFGTTGSNTANTGMRLRAQTSNALTWRVSSAGAAVNAASRSTDAYQAGKWNLLGVSVDESAGTGLLVSDATISSFTATYSSPAAGSADYTMDIGALGNANTPLPNGSRLGPVAIWSGAALNASQIAAFKDATRGRFGV